MSNSFAYRVPNEREKDISRLACLLDEAKGKTVPGKHKAGHHPKVWCQKVTNKQVEAMRQELRDILSKKPITSFGPDLQLWYRNDQGAPKRKAKNEQQASD